MEAFDSEVLEPEAGVRALWLLYKRGRWGDLEDFGLEREKVEDALAAFDAENITEDRLTRAQVRRLVAMVPGLWEAGVELRLAYALKHYDEARNHPFMEGRQNEVQPLSRRGRNRRSA